MYKKPSLPWHSPVVIVLSIAALLAIESKPSIATEAMRVMSEAPFQRGMFWLGLAWFALWGNKKARERARATR